MFPEPGLTSWHEVLHTVKQQHHFTDCRLGLTRMAHATKHAMLLQTPNFILGLRQPAAENEATVPVGHLAWSGNFKLQYEADSYQNLRFSAGINSFASAC